MKKTLMIGGWSTACLLAVLAAPSCQPITREPAETATFIPDEAALTQDVYEPDEDFTRAEQAFEAKQYEKSAEEIRHALPYMEQLADLSDSKGRIIVENAISTLEDVARDVEFDKVANQDELKSYLRQATASLAHSKVIVAENLMVNGQQEQARQLLESVMRRFDQDAETLGTYLNGQDQQIAQDIEALSDKIDQKVPVDRADLQAIFAKLKTDFQELQTKINLRTNEQPS